MQRVKEKAIQLLQDQIVDRVIGWRAGEFFYDLTPSVFTSVEDIEKNFVWSVFSGANLSKYLIAESRKGGKAAVFLKPCDSYSFVQLLKEHRILRETVYAVGVQCGGMCDMEAIKEQGLAGVTAVTEDGEALCVSTIYGEETIKKADALLVGARNLRSDNMPGKNTFANKFSNFWFRVETGMRLDDTQSGFRLYPVRRMKGMRFLTRRYEFEVEVLVRAAWRGIAVRNIPVNVFYPEKDERVTHFRPGKDFTRISILNTFLVLGALLFYYPWRFLRSLTKENIRRFVADNITRSRDSNPQLAASIGLGIFFGIAPLWGYQMIAAGVTAHFTRLNKAVAILSSNISIPPMIPFILYGSYWTGAQVLRRAMPLSLSDITLERAAADMFQYVVGSFVMAAVCAVAAAAVSYALLVFCKRTPRHE